MSPHGIPVDLLDRLVIIRTLQYVLEEIIAILNTRAKVSPMPMPCSMLKAVQDLSVLSSYIKPFFLQNSMWLFGVKHNYLQHGQPLCLPSVCLSTSIEHRWQVSDPRDAPTTI